MADAHQLKLIEQGIEVWNRWRDSHPEIKPDLSQAYLYEAELSGANLSDVNLSRACLIGANLKEANFRGANLHSAYMSTAHLTSADLSQADLQEANFSEADLSHANFCHAHAKAANFTSATLTGACLEGWQIDTSTLFEGAICQYFYWRQQQQERFPQVGEFTFTNFTKLIQEYSGFVSEPAHLTAQDAIAASQHDKLLPQVEVDLTASLLTVPRPPQAPALPATQIRPARPAPHHKLDSKLQTALKLELTGSIPSSPSNRRSPNKSAAPPSQGRSAITLVADPVPSQTITVRATDGKLARSSKGHSLQAALPQSSLLLAESHPQLEPDDVVHWFMVALACVGVGAAIALITLWVSSQWSSNPAVSPVFQQHRVEGNTRIFEGV